MVRVNEQPLSAEALAMAYVAGELSAEHRAELERRMQLEPDLRQRVQELAEGHAELESSLESADALERLPVTPDLAVRNVMRQWRQRQFAPSQEIPAARPVWHFRIPAWAYPAAAAALLLIAFSYWWANNTPAPEVADQSPPAIATPDSGATEAPGEPARPEDVPMAFSPVHPDQAGVLSNMESDAVSLTRSDEDFLGLWSDNNQ